MLTGSIIAFGKSANGRGKQVRGMALILASLLISGCLHQPQPSESLQRAAQIEAFYAKWHGTSYQYGGNDGNGLDCSALMVEAYDEIYDASLPRTTEQQSELGKRVRLKNLRSGDLVFFKTGIVRRHVGIYLQNGIFIHSSLSRGVVKSSLHNAYWRDRFWKAKRLL